MNNFQKQQAAKILASYNIDNQENIEKATYKDTHENRRLGRVGQEYGGGKEPNTPKTTLTNLEWGSTTEQRNRNTKMYESLKSVAEKERFLKDLKNISDNNLPEIGSFVVDKEDGKRKKVYGVSGSLIFIGKDREPVTKDEIEY